MVALTCAVTWTMCGMVMGRSPVFTEPCFSWVWNRCRPVSQPGATRTDRVGTDYCREAPEKGVNNGNYALCVSAVAVTVAAAQVALELRGDGVAARLGQFGGVLALLQLLDVFGDLA